MKTTETSAKQKPKKKFKSYTPVVFALSADQKRRLKEPPHASLTKFKEGTATATDWHNVLFRVKTGLEIAKMEYDDTFVKSLQTGVDTIMAIKDRRTDDKDWKATEVEITAIEWCLKDTDQLYNETTRRIQLDANIATIAFTKHYIYE